MAAADQAAHIRSAEGGRAGERERARKARRRLPAACRHRCLLSADAESPRPPHPLHTRFTPTSRKGRGKRRGTSLPASGTQRIPQSPAATALVKRWQQRLQTKNKPTLARACPHPPQVLFRARQAPPPTQRQRVALVLGCACSVLREAAFGGKRGELQSKSSRPIAPKSFFSTFKLPRVKFK